MIDACETLTNDVKNYLYVADEAKEKGRLRPDALKAKVLALYEIYLNRVLDEGGPLVDSYISIADQKELAKNEYYLKLAYFKELRASILNSTPWRKCPYCYQLKATEVDHYLPKSQFGEYAVYAPNLVPICRICNGKKLNKYARQGGGRRFLHPYFDEFPAPPARYLAATVSVGDSVLIDFEVVKPVGMSDEIWTLHLNQFTELDLATRYTEDAVETITGMLLCLKDSFNIGGGPQVAKQLQAEQASREGTYGLNHWWPVMLEALAASTAFCDGGFNVLDPSGIGGV